MSLRNNINLQISGELSDIIGVATVTGIVKKTIVNALSDSDMLFTVTDTTPADPYANTYDLADETLTDPLGNDVEMGTVEFIYFKNTSENALILGGGDDDIAVLEDGLSVPAGGVVILLGNYDVGPAADQITITGTAADDTYELIVIGTTPEEEPEP